MNAAVTHTRRIFLVLLAFLAMSCGNALAGGDANPEDLGRAYLLVFGLVAVYLGSPVILVYLVFLVLISRLAPAGHKFMWFLGTLFGYPLTAALLFGLVVGFVMATHNQPMIYFAYLVWMGVQLLLWVVLYSRLKNRAKAR